MNINFVNRKQTRSGHKSLGIALQGLIYFSGISQVVFAASLVLAVIIPTRAVADSFFFSTGNVTNQIATASRPSSPGKIEIESADDFVLNALTRINQATFTGLVTTGSTVSEVVIEIYRVFPNDSDVGRTSGPPNFSTPNVPTRVNSPSDVELVSRDSSVAGELAFSTTTLAASFMALNSVLNGINHTTGGDGPVTGQEVQFNVTFTDPFLLPGDHYFFVPQVLLNTGDFFWLSGTRPIVPPGTPFAPDLQSWIRNANLDPDWLRIGTDIVGGSPAPMFNAAFTLTGTTPEPNSLILLGIGLVGFGWLLKRGG